MIWCIALLVPLTALMMGAVHPWAFKAAEESVLTLVMVWAARIALGKCPFPAINPKLRFPFVASLALLVIVASQLLPLPVRFEKLISPSTYNLYKLSLPGWPNDSPYSWLSHEQMFGETTIYGSEGLNKNVGHAPADAFIQNVAKSESERSATVWLPISVAPPLTVEALLNLISCLSLGFLVILYPFPVKSDRTRSIYQVLVLFLLATGLLLGFVGLSEELFPNGKPLWIFSPYDFRGQAVWRMRAFGPFANPDHFACFLAMLLPPAIALMFDPGMLGRVRERAAVPLFAAVVVVVIIVVLLATASRGGMLNALVGVVVLGWMFSRLPRARQPALFRGGRKKRIVLVTVAVGLFSLAAFLTGSFNRTLADSRLHTAFASESFLARLGPTEDTLHMIADFPFFGVGLGAWPDIYRKYTAPPWSPVFMNAVHNEYVQFLSETGVVGSLVAASIVLSLVWGISRRVTDLSNNQFAVIAAFIASLAGLAAHAALDFPLRIPAIAILGTILSAAVIRALFQDRLSTTVFSDRDRTQVRFGAAGAMIIVIGIMWSVLQQPRLPYPYNLTTPQNYSQMAQLLLTHPVNSRVHLTLVGLIGSQTALREEQSEELRTVISLEPNNPIARDLYLRALARNGQNEAALDEMTRSVFYAPDTNDHFYLSPKWVPKLTAPEKRAIETGLVAAVKKRFDTALIALGDFDDELGEFQKEGEVFEQAAIVTHDTEQRARFLSRAGRSFAKAGDFERAIGVLHTEIGLFPDRPDAYEVLGLEVYVPQHDFRNARSAINQGIKAGADSTKLYLKLAQVNRAAHDKAGEEEALNEAAASEPLSFELTYSLGTAYLDNGRADEAILWLRKAARVKPDSAQAFFELAEAEESVFQFLAAQDDYKSALALDPANPGMQERFLEFKDKVATSSPRN